MAHQQLQAFCSRCNQPRLHTRDVYDVPHLLHFLMTMVFFGAWIPIWIIHTLVNSVDHREPYRCTNCGEGIADPQSASCLIGIFFMLGAFGLVTAMSLVIALVAGKTAPAPPVPARGIPAAAPLSEPKKTDASSQLPEPEARAALADAIDESVAGPTLPPLPPGSMARDPFAAPADPPASTLRAWTDAAGQSLGEAEFAGLAFGRVKLRRADGEIVEVSYDGLSITDQEWIRRRR